MTDRSKFSSIKGPVRDPAPSEESTLAFNRLMVLPVLERLAVLTAAIDSTTVYGSSRSTLKMVECLCLSAESLRIEAFTFLLSPPDGEHEPGDPHDDRQLDLPL